MKTARLVLGSLCVLAACGGNAPAQRSNRVVAPSPDPELDPSYRPGRRKIPSGDVDDGDGSSLTLQSEHGALDQSDVDQVLEDNAHAFTGCYDRSGASQKYVAGQVRLKLVVDEKGAVENAYVMENTLGNYAVERCLVVEARRLIFPRPYGGKSAEIEYPLVFKSAGETAVVDWQATALASQVGPLMGQLAPCPPLGADEVTAVIYIQLDGSVGSAGLASSGPVDPEGGLCAVEHLRRWRFPRPSGHIVRSSFQVHVPAESSKQPAVVAPVHHPVKRRVH